MKYASIGFMLQKAEDRVYFKGVECQDEGKVGKVSFNKGIFSAKVEGDGDFTYDVEIEVNRYGLVLDVSCTCPGEWGGLCVHMIAVGVELLSSIYPRFKPYSIDEVLEKASKEELAEFIKRQIGYSDKFEVEFLEEFLK